MNHTVSVPHAAAGLAAGPASGPVTATGDGDVMGHAAHLAESPVTLEDEPVVGDLMEGPRGELAELVGNQAERLWAGATDHLTQTVWKIGHEQLAGGAEEGGERLPPSRPSTAAA